MVLKKIKIKLQTGYILQYKFFNFPVFQIENTQDGKKFKFCFLKRKVKKGAEHVFYLKVNQSSWVNIECIGFWIDVIDKINGDYYIICDNERLKNLILENITFKNSDIKFIKSNKTILKKTVNSICTNEWLNAGYAHLTPFVHAYKNKIENFWNIDADDSRIFYDSKSVAESLEKVEEYANKNNIDVFGYDVLQSRYNGKEWCFGVTYVNKNSKTYPFLFNVDKNFKFIHNLKHLNCCNADIFFTYLRDNNKLNIQSFTFENIYYTHLGTGFEALIYSFYVKNNQLIYPIYKAFLPDKNHTFPVNDRTIIFNFGFDEEKSKKIMVSHLCDWFDENINHFWTNNS